MTKQEFAKIAMAIKTYYPKENLLPNEQAVELWFLSLQDIEYETAALVLRKWVATNKWSPTIADIREQAAEILYGKQADWSEGWEAVVQSFGRFGMYREAEALESFDEITRDAVKRIGYLNLCTSENLDVDRASFRMIYKEIAERKKTEKQLPVELVRLIRETAQKTALLEAGGKD